jgi:hypothetical protein
MINIQSPIYTLLYSGADCRGKVDRTVVERCCAEHTIEVRDEDGTIEGILAGAKSPEAQRHASRLCRHSSRDKAS